MLQQYPEVSSEWFSRVSSLVWSCGARGAASLGTLLARLCGGAHWWGERLADLLCDTFSPHDAPPRPLDRSHPLLKHY